MYLWMDVSMDGWMDECSFIPVHIESVHDDIDLSTQVWMDGWMYSFESGSVGLLDIPYMHSSNTGLSCRVRNAMCWLIWTSRYSFGEGVEASERDHRSGMDACMYVCMYGASSSVCMDGWMDGWMYLCAILFERAVIRLEKVLKQANVIIYQLWMDACMYVSTYLAYSLPPSIYSPIHSSIYLTHPSIHPSFYPSK